METRERLGTRRRVFGRWRWTRRNIAIVATLIGIAAIVAAAVYRSNQLSGTTTTAQPLRLEITSNGGTFPTQFVLETPATVSWKITNNVGTTLTVNLWWNGTASGFACADVTITTSPGGVCSASGDTLSFKMNDVSTPGNSFIAPDFTYAFHRDVGSIAWTAEATGHT